MHELPIVKALLEKIVTTTQKHKVKRVVGVRIKLGEFSGFVDESVEFYWEIITKGTVAEGARLEMVRTKGELECTKCGKKIPKLVELCPKCGSFRLSVTAGGDYELDEIEVE